MPDEPNSGQQPDQTAAPTPEQIEERNRNIARVGLSRLGYAIAEAQPPPAKEVEPEKQESADDTKPEGQAASTETPPAEAATEQQKAAEPAPADAAPAPDQPPKRKLKKVEAPKPAATLDDIKEIVSQLAQRPAATAPAAAAPASQKPTEPELQPQDREEFELAKFAEQADPEKYRGMSQRWLEFVQKRDAFAAAKIKEDGEFDPNSDDFRQFVEQNRPGYQRGDRRKLEVAKIEDGAVQRARKEFEKEKVELRREIAKITTVPHIHQATTRVIEDILGDDDPSIKEFKEDPKKFMEAVPLEANVIDSTLREVSSMTSEYLKIARGIEDADPNNHTHVMLDRFIEVQGLALERKPEAERIRDGKILIGRARYAELAQKRDPSIGRFATFTDDDIVTMIKEGGRLKIRKTLEPIRSTYVRKAQAAPPAAQKPEEKKSEQKPAPAKSGGAATSAPAATSSPGSPPPAKGASTRPSSHMRSLGYSS